eukprot:6195638-Pleurochrysis_carterae.AAC.7
MAQNQNFSNGSDCNSSQSGQTVRACCQWPRFISSCAIQIQVEPQNLEKTLRPQLSAFAVCDGEAARSSTSNGTRRDVRLALIAYFPLPRKKRAPANGDAMHRNLSSIDCRLYLYTIANPCDHSTPPNLSYYHICYASVLARISKWSCLNLLLSACDPVDDLARIERET